MEGDIFQYIVGVAQIVVAPLGTVLVGIGIKLYRKIKLMDYKQEAMVHAMQRESSNGFTEAYYKKLEELISEDVFINKGKRI